MQHLHSLEKGNACRNLSEMLLDLLICLASGKRNILLVVWHDKRRDLFTAIRIRQPYDA